MVWPAWPAPTIRVPAAVIARRPLQVLGTVAADDGRPTSYIQPRYSAYSNMNVDFLPPWFGYAPRLPSTRSTLLLTIWAAPARLAMFARAPAIGMISMTGTHDFGLG